MPLCEVEVLLPVVGGDVVLARPHVVADGVAHRLVDRRHLLSSRRPSCPAVRRPRWPRRPRGTRPSDRPTDLPRRWPHTAAAARSARAACAGRRASRLRGRCTSCSCRRTSAGSGCSGRPPFRRRRRRLIAAPPSPESFEITMAKRASIAPAQSAVLPSREWPISARRAGVDVLVGLPGSPPPGSGPTPTRRWRPIRRRAGASWPGFRYAPRMPSFIAPAMSGSMSP